MAEVALRNGKRKKQICKNCGKPGHRASTCSEDSASQVDDVLEPITEEQWKDVNEAHDHGLKTPQIAEEMGISIRDANLALQTATYQVYLHRKKS